MGIKFKRAMMSSERKTNNKEFRVSLPNIIYAKDAMSYVFVFAKYGKRERHAEATQNIMHNRSTHTNKWERYRLVIGASLTYDAP